MKQVQLLNLYVKVSALLETNTDFLLCLYHYFLSCTTITSYDDKYSK